MTSSSGYALAASASGALLRPRNYLAALAFVALGQAASGAHAAYGFTEVARPGASTTVLWDINNLGQMVGSSTAGTGSTDFATGFVFDGTSFTSLTGPAGAISSEALGISDGGKVVGSFSSTSFVDTDGNVFLGAASGYIYQGGSYTTFNVAGAADTYLRGISPDGRYLSGYYSTATQSGVGFVYDTVGGFLSTLSQPDSTFTIAQGINNGGIVVGSDRVGTPETRPGFYYDINTGTRTNASIAGAATTALRSIDGAGVVAGWFTDSFATHGFVGSVTSFEQIDFTGADGTIIEGSNNAGVLVGGYTLGEGGGAFIARPIPEPGTVTLWTLGLLALGWKGSQQRVALRRSANG